MANGGDCITLVSKILNIGLLDAAKFINDNLGLGINISRNDKYNFNQINTYKQKRLAKEQFEKWKKESFNKLCDYFHEVQDKYNEKCKKYSSVEEADTFFEDEDVIKYYREADIIDYYIDLYIYGDEEDLINLKKTKGKVVKL